MFVSSYLYIPSGARVYTSWIPLMNMLIESINLNVYYELTINLNVYYGLTFNPLLHFNEIYFVSLFK